MFAWDDFDICFVEFSRRFRFVPCLLELYLNSTAVQKATMKPRVPPTHTHTHPANRFSIFPRRKYSATVFVRCTWPTLSPAVRFFFPISISLHTCLAHSRSHCLVTVDRALKCTCYWREDCVPSLALQQTSARTPHQTATMPSRATRLELKVSRLHRLCWKGFGSQHGSVFWSVLWDAWLELALSRSDTISCPHCKIPGHSDVQGDLRQNREFN